MTAAPTTLRPAPRGPRSTHAFDAKKAKFASGTWTRDNAAVDAAQAKSRANVKAIVDGGDGPVCAGGAMMLVGSGHDPRVVAYVERQDDYEKGVINVTKGGAFRKGTLKVSGIARNRVVVEKMLKAFSDKTVQFE